jgi:hypothetical protein
VSSSSSSTRPLDELRPASEAAYAPLIKLGLLAGVGGGDVGCYLAQYEGISHLHIAGISPLPLGR